MVVSHYLVSDLERQERQNMTIWAEAMRTISLADENTDLGLALKVLEGNNTIPIVVKDRNGNIIDQRNIPDSTKMLNVSRKRDFIRIFLESDALCAGDSVRLYFDASQKKDVDYIDVHYDESIMLKRLELYPYVQLGVVLIFVIVAIFALLTSKKAEQNKVWVGLSKETAHQLGTPISSLMAWTAVLHESYPDDSLLLEMEKDVRRLQLIAERFSKIGSVPEASPTSLRNVLVHVIDYMDRRTSARVQMVCDFPHEDVMVCINASLFEWVIENLCKNAVDAMEGSGTIRLRYECVEGRVVLDVSDDGKGIRKKNIKNVFKPGFTTKSRGWGLGLSLAKRIVEEYHHGKIYVLSSEVGKGTTFRIELRS